MLKINGYLASANEAKGPQDAGMKGYSGPEDDFWLLLNLDGIRDKLGLQGDTVPVFIGFAMLAFRSSAQVVGGVNLDHRVRSRYRQTTSAPGMDQADLVVVIAQDPGMVIASCIADLFMILGNPLPDLSRHPEVEGSSLYRKSPGRRQTGIIQAIRSDAILSSCSYIFSGKASSAPEGLCPDRLKYAWLVRLTMVSASLTQSKLIRT